MPEELQEPKSEEQAVEAPFVAALPPNWLRLAYVIEYLFALQVGLFAWTQVGGEGHMDLLPWYFKLSCVILFAWCMVRFTAATVEERAMWNRRSRLWLGGVLLIATAMAGITLYYHLHEDTEDPNSDELPARSVLRVVPGSPVWES